MWPKSKKNLASSDKPVSERKLPDVGLSSSHEFIEWLGSGGSGDTYLMRDLATDQLVAVKLIPRPIPKAIVPQHIYREIKIQAELGEGHVCIIDAKEAILTEKHLAIVLEYAAGGSMTSYVSNKWQQATHTGLFLSEDEARYFFRQFLNAVEYCHHHKVAHRDLKLDNTLLTDSNPPILKLCDFGFARGWGSDADTNMYTHIGTPVYMAPEVIDASNGMRGYDAKKADAWSCGVLLVAMLLGTFPYDHQKHPDPNSKEAQQEVWHQQVYKPWTGAPQVKNASKRISPECKDLIDRIFALDRTQRISVEEMKQHPWCNKPLSARHEKALAQILKTQEDVAQRSAKLNFDTQLLAARDQQLMELVELARVRAERSWTAKKKPLVRIDLSDRSVLKWGTAEIPSEGRRSEDLPNQTQQHQPQGPLSDSSQASFPLRSPPSRAQSLPQQQQQSVPVASGQPMSFTADEETFRRLRLN